MKSDPSKKNHKRNAIINDTLTKSNTECKNEVNYLIEKFEAVVRKIEESGWK